MRQFSNIREILKKVIKSYIPATNALSKIEISIQQVLESVLRQKRGRPTGSKDKNP